MVTRKTTQKFTPAILAEIAPKLKAESKILKTLYDAISSISEELMTRAGTPIKPPYEEFLTKRLRGTLLKYKREEKEIEARDSYDKKNYGRLRRYE